MRHNFVNDIGDYAKYALLRAVCAASDRPIGLGIIWYLTEHAERNGDGRKRAHLWQAGWEDLDPVLLATMRQIENTIRDPGELNLGLIEGSGIFPPGTRYFSEPIGSRVPWPEQRKRVCAQITSATNRPVTIRSLRFGAFGVRAFFCVTTSPHLTSTVERGLEMLRSRVDACDKSRYLLLE